MLSKREFGHILIEYQPMTDRQIGRSLLAECAASSTRDTALDALKGVGILSVVLSHALQFCGGPAAEPALGVVWSFSMPLFVYLSGLAFGYSRKRALWDEVRHRAKTLITPYVAWTFIYLIVYWMAPGELWRSPASAANGPWYLAALFLFVLVARVTHIERGGVTDVLRVGALALLAYGVARVSPSPDWHLWTNVSRLLPYFALGFLVNMNPDWRRLTSTVPSVALVIVYSISIAALWPVRPSSSLLNNLQASSAFGALTHYAVLAATWGLAFAAGLCGTLLIERAVRRLHGRIVEILSRAGVRSLGIYLIHGIIVRAWPGTGVGAVVASFTVAFAASYAITVAISRSRPLRTVLLGGR